MKGIQAEVKVEELAQHYQQRLLAKEPSVKLQTVQSIVWAQDLQNYHRQESDFLSNLSAPPYRASVQMAERALIGLLSQGESNSFMGRFQTYRQKDAYIFIILGFVRWKLEAEVRFQNILDNEIGFYLNQARKNENIDFEALAIDMKDMLNVCRQFLKGSPNWAVQHLLNLRKQEKKGDNIHEIQNLMRSFQLYFMSNFNANNLQEIMEEFSRLFNGETTKIKTEEELRQYHRKMEQQRRKQFMLKNPFLITKQDEQQTGGYSKGMRGLI